MRQRLSILAATLLLACGSPARASGIPVIDVANLLQTVQQVMNDIT